jgi:D-alanine-D-alanine ligase
MSAREFDAASVVARAGRVLVLMGGDSAEREVSLRSGAAVTAALARAGVNVEAMDFRAGDLPELLARRPDRVFIALHGRGGEDGLLQGALGLAGIPFTGSDVLGCALAMDKIRSKQIWQSVGIPTPNFMVVDEHSNLAEIVARIGLPMAVKPAHEGSSVGVSKVEQASDLPAAIALARQFDSAVLAESWVSGGEYTLSIVDGQTLPLIKLETPRQFYDYEAKYLANTTKYICPCGLSAELEARLAEQGLRAFRALGASAWGRVDFMLDPAGQAHFIELNTVPGMTDHSLVPMAASAFGWGFEHLVLRILALSFERAV